MWKAIVAVCVGASAGALLRWWLGAQFNSLLPAVPPGTLAANLIGCYVIGLAIAFSAAGAHLFGSLLATVAGIGTVLWARA